MVTGCALPVGRSLLARAIDARGGPIERIERSSEGLVHVGLPGRWQWRLVFEPPERMRFTLVTAGEDQDWVTDGRTASTLLGSTVVSSEPLADSQELSAVRWVAAVHLDALRDPAIFRTRELPPEDVPEGRFAALEGTTTDAPAMRYRLVFDRQLRLVEAEGPLSIPAVGSGRVHAVFSDFRWVDGRRLPFEVRYRLDETPLLEEHVVEQHVSPAGSRSFP